MKCTRTVEYGTKCGKETGKPCPAQWIKHQEFDPLVLRILFEDTEVATEDDLEALDAFVCPDCMRKWQHYKSRSRNIKEGKAKAKASREDYSI